MPELHDLSIRLGWGSTFLNRRSRYSLQTLDGAILACGEATGFASDGYARDVVANVISSIPENRFFLRFYLRHGHNTYRHCTSRRVKKQRDD